MPRTAATSFQPEELFPLWETYGQPWVATQTKLVVAEQQQTRAGESSGHGLEQPTAIDPEGLRLLEGEGGAVPVQMLLMLPTCTCCPAAPATQQLPWLPAADRRQPGPNHP